jgi:anti-anti-sigma factor
MSEPSFPDPGPSSVDEPSAQSDSGATRRGFRERIATSAVWPLIIGGRPQPIRHSEMLSALEVSVLPGKPGGLQVRGDVDVLSILHLERALADSDLPVPFVLDLSGVTFMDGVGVALLRRLAQMADGTPAVILRNPSRSVTRVLTIAAPEGIPGLQVQLAPQTEAEQPGALPR